MLIWVQLLEKLQSHKLTGMKNIWHIDRNVQARYFFAIKQKVFDKIRQKLEKAKWVCYAIYVYLQSSCFAGREQ